jgi:hypothetical protein
LLFAADFPNNNIKLDNQTFKRILDMKNTSEDNEKSYEKIRLYFNLLDL